MFSATVLVAVLVVASVAVAVAYRERQKVAREVAAFVAGMEERIAARGSADGGGSGPIGVPVPEDLAMLLDEAIQLKERRLAVLAINEISGRAALARSRSLLLARGLSRIALLTGALGAFLIVAAGHFQKGALVQAGASVGLGLFGSFACHGLTVAARRLAKRYADGADLLARQMERQNFEGEE